MRDEWESNRRYTGRRTGRNNKKRKRRRIRRIIKCIFCIALIIPVITVVLWARDMITGRGNLAVMALTDPKVREVVAHKDQYPEELIELLENNAETADFVLGYPEKKDTAPAETIGDVTQGEIPLLLQWDERWGYAYYADDMIAVNGCGPTAIAMVAAGLTGDNTVTPYKVAQFSAGNGYYAGDSGTSWSLMTEGAQQFGIYGEEMGLSEDEVFSALENGHPIICSMRPGDFTTTGHFIVLTGVEDGKIRVNDPNSRVRSGKLWDYSRLEYQINNLWVYTAM
ncbi:C39 family peptidase [Mediterraneibacter glycyrrhizinilyticus]|uniref:C39 family peptidase n=1 Tax=Mediterraneibacter glycyrrhizinilyticus TaxID=342942 RepID=UPI00195FEB4F|nr:C39 family peptidase [Mediterraneibacter glycyrrhizinilyticus]MBM6803597.1 C39 family peptidase [Mediterraneibacter glycyrrhizinilyticus]MDM8126021.1 C39 family peptidase [Mediterraneibacter glycyrrhizinilyticus]